MADAKKNADVEVTKLWTAALKADKACDDAKAALEAGMKTRSAAVKAILDAMGAGPFQTPFGVVTISSRTAKTVNEAGEKVATGETVYFFKGQKNQQVTVIKL